jgi:hypothetical protein
MRRRVLALAAATGLLTVVVGLVVNVGFATSLPATSATLGDATTLATRCTTAGLGVLQNFSGAAVVSVTVTGIPSTCGTATLNVAVNNGSTSSTGSAAVPVAGGSVTVTLGTSLAVGTAEETDLVFVGP